MVMRSCWGGRQAWAQHNTHARPRSPSTILDVGDVAGDFLDDLVPPPLALREVLDLGGEEWPLLGHPQRRLLLGRDHPVEHGLSLFLVSRHGGEFGDVPWATRGGGGYGVAAGTGWVLSSMGYGRMLPEVRWGAETTAKSATGDKTGWV